VLFQILINNKHHYFKEQQLIKTLRGYGYFTITEIGNRVWYASLECRPCILSPVTATRTNKLEAILRVDAQVRGVMLAAVGVVC